MNNNRQFIGAGIIAIGLFMFWILPFNEYSKLASLRTAIEQNDNLLEERMAIQSQIEDYKTKYDQQANEIRTFVAIVPTKRETAEIISAVEVIASQNGIQLNEVVFSEGTAQTDKNYNTMRIVMTGRGSYGSIRGILNAIERNIRLIDVQGLRLTSDAQTGQLNFEIQADVYFLK